MKRIGILIPLLPEAACLVRRARPGQVQSLTETISVDVCGLGPERAREGAARLLQHGAEALISLGTAGALGPGLAAGDIVIPDRVLRDGTPPLDVHAAWRRRVMNELAGLPLHGGSLLHVGQVIASPQDKRRLHETSGAVAADMESAILLEEARRHGLPALVLRVIIDRAEARIPACALQGSDVYGRARTGRMLRSLLARPQQLPALLGLARDYRRAARSLRLLGREPERLRPPA